MSNQQSTVDGFQVPPGMMLVPVPQQYQQQTLPRTIEPSQQPAALQYKTSTVTNNNSFKRNKVAPPPSAHNTQTGSHATVSNCMDFQKTSFPFQ